MGYSTSSGRRDLDHPDSDKVALSTFDVATLFVYFTVVAMVSVLVSRHQAKNSVSSTKSKTDAYFLAERSVAWYAVAASLFASNIGAEHFVGLAGSAARSGVAVGFYETGAIVVIIFFLALFFLPTYLNAQIDTTPDYLKKRYTQYCRTLVVCVSLLIYIVSKIAATIMAGEIILVQLIHVNKLLAVVLLVAFTALYTVLGGLEAVIYTEVLQTVVLLIGGFMVLGFSLGSVGGWSSLKAELTALDSVPDNYFHVFRSPDDTNYPWTGFLFGFFVIAPWYWGIDQVMVQRALAAKNLAHGQLGCVVASLLKFVPGLVMILPGICARALVERLDDGVKEHFEYDTVYPWLVLNVIPLNFRGIIVAGMLSSLMSALASVFNSSATLFSLNIYKQIYPDASDARLVLVGRVAVVVTAILALCWLPVMPMLGNSLFIIIQKPPAYVAPPILCLYLWGMLSRYPTRRAGSVTLTAGLLAGAFRFFLEVIEDVSGQRIFGLFTSINFLHFAAVSFWCCSFLLFVSSFLFRRTYSYTAMDSHQAPDEVEENLLFRRSLYSELMRSSQLKPVQTDDLDFDDSTLNGSIELTTQEQRSLQVNQSESAPTTPVEPVNVDVTLSDLGLEDSASSSSSEVATKKESFARRRVSSRNASEGVREEEDDAVTNIILQRCPSESTFEIAVLNKESCVSRRTIGFMIVLVLSLWLLQIVTFA